MKTQKTVGLVALLSVAAALAGCAGFLNLGGTTETGEPKTAADARAIFRSVGDAALRTWGTALVREKVPHAMVLFDVDADGVLTLAELENAVNLEDPNSLTLFLVMAIEIASRKEN